MCDGISEIRRARVFVMAVAAVGDDALSDEDAEKILDWAEKVSFEHEMLMSVLGGLCVPKLGPDGKVGVTLASKVLPAKTLEFVRLGLAEMHDPRSQDYATYSRLANATGGSEEAKTDVVP